MMLTITQLAQELGVTPRTLRFYEDKGLLSPVRLGRNRVYNAIDLTTVQFIIRMKDLGMRLVEIKTLIDFCGAAPIDPEKVNQCLDEIWSNKARRRKRRAVQAAPTNAL
jgi:DNA-binding transcriptional MerR regulator